MIAGRVLDTSAVLDLSTGSTQYAAAMLTVATDLAMPLVIPSSALQEAWFLLAPDHGIFLELLVDLSVVLVEDLTEPAARGSGRAARETAAEHWLWSAAQAHVAQCSRTRGWPVLTRVPEAFVALDPALFVESLPGD